MAFKRTSFTKLTSTSQKTFATAYKFSTQANFAKGKDVYIIPLGLEEGYYETPCHTVRVHKVEGQIVGFKGSTYNTNIKCHGIDEEGNRTESLCCILAQREKDRIPDKENSGNRIISFQTSRIHLPVLILGNTCTDDRPIYPISKVSILNELKSEKGLRFAFIDMAASSFQNDIVKAYGKSLKDVGELEYDLDEDGEEFLEEVRKRLSRTIIKVHGAEKKGFNYPLKEYTFFPLNGEAVAIKSGENERKAVTNFYRHPEIKEKINEFLTLFDLEVDGLVTDWKESELQEYYNSAIGIDLKAPLKEEVKEEVEETVEFIDEEPKKETVKKVVKEIKDEVSETPFDETDFVEDRELSEEGMNMLDEDLKSDDRTSKPITDTTLDDFEYDSEDDFFADDEG